jgi:O-acetyl-ADP-ribose deacetylase (regulator of RNase III)
VSIAFPSISTGVYGYPIELAAPVAVGAVREALLELPSIREVIFCCFSKGDLAVYQRVLG